MPKTWDERQLQELDSCQSVFAVVVSCPAMTIEEISEKAQLKYGLCRQYLYRLQRAGMIQARKLHRTGWKRWRWGWSACTEENYGHLAHALPWISKYVEQLRDATPDLVGSGRI